MGIKHYGKIVSSCVFALLSVQAARAQGVPWLVLADPDSDSVCDVVNASNVGLVILADSGELVIVSGTDEILLGSLVDVDLYVFFDGTPFGLIDFVEDADGFRTLWWLTFTGTVVEIDTLTLEPFDSGALPSDFADVACDACPLWDDPTACIDDSDADGVPDDIDDCPDTPLDEVADDFGCSCSEVDEDLDLVNDCDDECPNTPTDESIDDFGCSCSQVDCLPECALDDEDNDGINDCDDECPGTDPFAANVDAVGCEFEIVNGGGSVLVACGGLQALTVSTMFLGLMGLRACSRRGTFR